MVYKLVLSVLWILIYAILKLGVIFWDTLYIGKIEAFEYL